MPPSNSSWSVETNIIEQFSQKITRLNQTHGNPEYVDIAVAYFDVKGWNLIKEALKGKQKIRLLVGSRVRTGLEYDETYGSPSEIYRKDINSYIIGHGQAALENFQKSLEKTNMVGEKIIEIKYYPSSFLHAKMYLFRHGCKDKSQEDFALVTSANLTYPGLSENIELGVSVGQPPETQHIAELETWFQALWDDAVPFTAEITEFVNERLKRHDFDQVLKLLVKTQTEEEHTETEQIIHARLEENNAWLEGLKDFQKDAVLKAYMKLIKHSGVILADEVGLGKTYMSGALIKRELFDTPNSKVLVIAPPSLEGTWNDYLTKQKLDDTKVDFHKKSSSHLLLSEDTVRAKNTTRKYAKNYSLVIIDEAHQLRNEDTKAYDNIVNEFLPHLKHGTKVVLATATPLNNDLSDLKSLLNIFLPDDAFAYQGIYSIGNLFPKTRTIANNDIHGQMYLGLDMVMVRRTREFIQRTYTANAGDINFPKLTIPDFNENYQRYRYSDEYKELAEEIFNHLTGQGTFLALYSPGKYLPVGNAHRTSNGLIRTTLLKCLDSSPYALAKILDNMLNKHEKAIEAITATLAHKDYTFLEDVFPRLDFGDPELLSSIKDELGATNNSLEGLEEIVNQDELEEYLTSEDEAFKEQQSSQQEAAESLKNFDILLHKMTLQKFRLQITTDKEMLKKWRDRANNSGAGVNLDKNQKLLDLLKHIATTASSKDEKKVIIFFQSIPSLTSINTILKEKPDLRFGTVTGSTKTTEKQKILARFCPKTAVDITSSQEKLEEIDILLTTDTLAEGVNLQQAQNIIHYDLPWNPMRVIQRIGRINRLNSSHKEIFSYYLIPEEEIQHKIATTWSVLQLKIDLATKLLGEKNILKPNHSYEELTQEDILELQEIVKQDVPIIPQNLLDKLHKMGIKGISEENDLSTKVVQIVKQVTETEELIYDVRKVTTREQTMQTYEKLTALVDSKEITQAPKSSYATVKLPEEEPGVILTLEIQTKGKAVPVNKTYWIPSILLTLNKEQTSFTVQDKETIKNYLKTCFAPWWETVGEKVEKIEDLSKVENYDLSEKTLPVLKLNILKLVEEITSYEEETSHNVAKIIISEATRKYLAGNEEETKKFNLLNNLALPVSQKRNLEKIYQKMTGEESETKEASAKINIIYLKKKFDVKAHRKEFDKTKVNIVSWIAVNYENETISP